MEIDSETLRTAIRKELSINGLQDFGNRTLGWEEAAAFLGCTPGTLRVWVSKRKVPFCKVGRLTRFRRQDLESYLEQNFTPAIVK